MKKKTTEQFIVEANQIHGDRYDYSKVEYITNRHTITIICKIHGEFQQLPGSHLMRKNCIKCSYIDGSAKQRGNIDEFIQKSREVHGDTYDYSKVQYKGARAKVIIICRKHGEFQQTPHHHILRKQGCNICGVKLRSENKKYTQNEFIQKSTEIHGDTYDYSKVQYTGIYNKIIIICKKHGEFEQTPALHIQGSGCNNCGCERTGILLRHTNNDFITKAFNEHGETYDYSKVQYIRNSNKVIIICKKHGEFEQTPYHHIKGSGCPLCLNKTEGKVFNNMQSIYPSLIAQFKQDWCKNEKPLPFDFCIPEYKIIIELDGLQHFKQISNWSSPEEQFENDKFKEECANNNGYSVIRLLQEDVFYDTYDWLKKLCDTIEEVKNSDKPKNRYLCENGEYENYY